MRKLSPLDYTLNGKGKGCPNLYRLNSFLKSVKKAFAAIFDEKSPFFFVYFGHFLDNFRALFLFDQYQRVPDY